MDDRTARCSEDFGGLVRRYPARVLRATSLLDVVNAVEIARRARQPLAVRGLGHSTRGQSLVEGGVVLDASGLDDIAVFPSDRTVTVGAGARWDEVLRRTVPAGLTVPVLPDYLGLTVGGTLSVGGVGGQSHRHGLVASNVERLTVVTGDGEVLACSRDRNQDLFDAARCGLGLCGIIVEAKIRLVPAPDRVAVVKVRYADLGELMRDQRRIAKDGRFDYFLTSFDVEDGRFRLWLEAVKHLEPGEPGRREALLADLSPAARDIELRETSYLAYANRLETLPAIDRERGRYHPWMDVFVGASRAEPFIADLLARLEPRELAGGHLMTYVVDRSKIDAPIVRWPDDELLLLVDILPTFASLSEASVFSRRCAPILGRARAIGGRVYPIGFPLGTEHMSRDDWKDHFDWPRLCAVKRRCDPSCRLGPGVGAIGREDLQG